MNENKARKKGIVKKIIVTTLVTASIIAGGKFLYSKIQNQEQQDPNPITEVKDYHEQSDNYKNLILDASKDLLNQKNQKLEEISFNNNSDGSLSIFTKVFNDEYYDISFYEYKLPNITTTNFEEIIETVKSYDFKDEVVENVYFKDDRYLYSLLENKSQGNYQSPQLEKMLLGWEIKEFKDGYYRFELDESGKCQKAIIGGFIIASKDGSQKTIRYEYSLDFSNVEKYYAQQLFMYLREGANLAFTEELVQEMSPNFLKSQYLGSETYVDEFTGDYDNSLNN